MDNNLLLHKIQIAVSTQCLTQDDISIEG